MTTQFFSPFAAALVLKAVALPDICQVHDLARHLRLAPTTIRRAFRVGILPGRKIGGRWLASRQAVLAALDPRERGARAAIERVARHCALDPVAHDSWKALP